MDSLYSFKSEQRTPGRTEKETGINNGNWYFTPYDKTHDFSLVSNYRINSDGISILISYSNWSANNLSKCNINFRGFQYQTMKQEIVEASFLSSFRYFCYL